MSSKFNPLKNFLNWKKDNSSSVKETATAESIQQVSDNLKKFQKKFKIEFDNPELIKTALKHRSYLSITNEPRTNSNERLEFLGDAVLDLIVAAYLYEKFPRKTEGELSKVKSILVRKSVLAEIAAKISLGDLILINWGEEKTGGRNRQSILADVFEAVVGAIYLDRGMEVATKFIHTHLLNDFKRIVRKELYINYKSILLEFTQSSGQGIPAYKVIDEIGPDHAKSFLVEVSVNGQKMGQGQGRTKKVAEQEAAKQAIKKLNIKN